MSGADALADAGAELERLRALVVRRLIEILERGDSERAPPAAYLSAAIKLLKDAGVFAESAEADEVSALLADLPSFDDDDDDQG